MSASGDDTRETTVVVPKPGDIRTKLLPNLNSEEFFCRGADPSSTALQVRIEHLDKAGMPYEYSNSFLKLCAKCPAQNMCASKISSAGSNIDINQFRHYRILDAHGKFRYIPKSVRPDRARLPKIFRRSDVNNRKRDGFDAGHIVAAFLGGMDCPFNLTMMDWYHNQLGYYKLMELYCEAYFSRLAPNILAPAKGYCTGMIGVKLRYNNRKNPMVPTHFMVQIELHRMVRDSTGKPESGNDYLSFNFVNPGGSILRNEDSYNSMEERFKPKREAVRAGRMQGDF